jgi:DNA (cytosine-5)-methyltransferase 1
MSIKEAKKLRVLDTFAGAGGFSLGFEQAGFEVVGAIEKDKWACDTFSFNHPDATVLRADITTISEKKILAAFKGKEPDVIIGGPPCQGFSIANSNGCDPKDPRNSLFKEFIRMGAIFKPKYMIMENVPSLLKAKTASKELVIDIIKQSLEQIGYHAYIAVLPAISYGVPQIRERLVVIGSLVPLKNPFPAPTHRAAGAPSLFDDTSLPTTPTLWDAISDLPSLDAGEGGEECDYTSKPKTKYQELLRRGSKKIYNHKAMCHTKRMVERFSSMKCGQSGNDVPNHLKPRKRNSQEISQDVYDQNNRRMHPSRPCHTIAASFYANFVHPFQHRNFTAREGARIQSFPDWYKFLGKPTVVSHKLLARESRETELHLCQYNQIGNAVPPMLAKAIAINLKKQI